MLMIRLARGGSKHRPFYHIRAADKRNARDGAYSEQLGYFNPIARGEEKRLVVDRARIEALVAQGAKVSDRVARLIKDDIMGAEEAAKNWQAKHDKLNKRKATRKKDTALAQQAEESTDKKPEEDQQ